MREPADSASLSSYLDVVEAEYTRIARIVYIMAGNVERSRDITQEAFTRLFAHWGRVVDYDFPGAWVRRVAIRLAWRATHELVTHVPFESIPEPVHIDVHGDIDLQRAILALPKRQRAAVALHYLDDLSIEESARVLQCSPGAVKTHLHRARGALSEMMTQEGDR